MNQRGVVWLNPGLGYFPAYLDRERQVDILVAIRSVVDAAPLFRPVMPKTGRPFSVRMSNCGRLGWVSDKAGYRYQATHPTTHRQWPPMPDLLAQAWRDLAGYQAPADACLVNYYDADARMGLHQDSDEEELQAAVVSLSLGDTCIFRHGGMARGDRTRSLKLESGDALVLGGAARLAFHGVDRIIAGSSTLLAEGGRFNLTLRRVSADPDHVRYEGR